MKREFTKLMAALALLVTLAIPMWMWADEAQYVFNTDAGIAALGIAKPSTGAGTSLSTTTPYTVGQISMSVTHGSTDTRVWNSSGTLDLRIYKNRGSLTFAATSGYNITGITITGSAVGIFTVNSGTYSSGSWSNGTTGASSVTFTATNTGKINTITVTYSASGSTLQESNLALVDAPVELEFDLYDNANAQTISYTTSSTGAVTVSQSNYITATVNANNTITVTPVAVTNGPQTITINQAADNTYAAGSVTFTVDIEDSTPTTGTDVTFDATQDLGNTTAGEGSIVKDGVTFTCSNGILGNGSEYRLYKNSTTTFSVTSGTITKIVFTCPSSNSASGFASQAGWTTNGTNGTWTGSAQSVSFTASGAQVRATQIDVTVETDGIPDPTISASNVDIAYSATSGSITYTINNEPTPAGTLTAAVTDGNWLTLGQGTTSPIAFTCTANENTTARTATVTLTYTYGNSETVSANVTVTQAAVPVSYTTIPALFAAATDAETPVYVTFNNWVVSGVSTNGKNVFVTDNNGNGFVMYFSSDMSSTYAVGNILSGTAVSCKLKKYNGFAELLNVDANDLTITTGGSVATSNIAMADLVGVNTGALVHYDGLTCSVTTSNNNTHYYLSDGTTSIQVYNALYDFSTLEEGETYNITGVYQQYNNIKEVMPRSAADIVLVPHEQYTLTIGSLTNAEMYTFVGGDYNNPAITNSGTAQVYDGSEVMLSVEPLSGYILESLIVDGVERINDITSGAYTFTMPTHAVTVTATAVVAPLYTVTFCDDNSALTELSHGAGVTLPTRTASGYTFAGWSTTNVGGTETTTAPAEIIPVGTYHPTMDVVLYPVYTRTEGGGSTTIEWHRITDLQSVVEGEYALLTPDNHAFNGSIISQGTSQGRGELTEDVFTFVNNIATSAPSDVCVLTFTAVTNGYTMYNSTNGYLSAKGATSGNLKWKDSESNYWHYRGSNWQYSEDFYKANASLRSMNNSYFNTYSNNASGSSALVLAKKVEVSSGTSYYTSLLTSYNLPVTAYSGDKDHYYLISSPVVGGSNPLSVERLLNTAGYDLYRFDQQGDEDGNEWLNYKQEKFNLQSGQGYLYANSESGNITFVGTPYSGNGQVTLYKKNCSNASGNFEGWNLVGNPFPQTAYIDRDCYVMNENRNQIVAGTSRQVAAMEGVFVIAASDGETMTFSTTAPGKADSKVVMNVIDNQGVADRAIVRFGEGSQLPKFQLKGNSTKVYFQQGLEGFAIVAAENEGELPVNFKASRNGRYTMSVDVENLDMNYLHLIDNKTGNDVDLLATPSYTFQANSSDYESRFRLVFDANTVNENNTTTTFAYFNGSEWVVNNNGNATLQVIDMMGRVLSSQTLNGNANVNINQAAGIYMLRLVNGENVQVQKVVVR